MQRRAMKRILGIFIALCMLFSLVGCMRVDFGVKINEDGTGSLTCKMSLSEELYQMMAQDSSGTGSEDDETLDTNEAASEAETEMDIKDFVKETIDGEVYYSYTQQKSFSSYGELIKFINTFELSDGMMMFDSVSITQQEKTYVFDAKTAVIDTGSESESETDSAMSLEGVGNDWLKLTFTIEMPGEITDTNGEIISDNTVRFNISDFTQPQTIHVESEMTSNLLFVFIAIVWGLGIIIMAFCIYKFVSNIKKKKAEAEIEASGEETEESVTEDKDE